MKTLLSVQALKAVRKNIKEHFQFPWLSLDRNPESCVGDRFE